MKKYQCVICGYVYDPVGNPITKTDAKGITVQYEYDRLNRLIAIHFPDSAQDILYGYDGGIHGLGRRTRITDPSGAIDFAYNARGRLIGATSIVNGYTYPLSREFTSGSRLSSITYPSGRTVDYARFATGKIRQVTTTHKSDTHTLIASISYNPFGVPNGMETGAGGLINNVSFVDCDCLI